MQRGSKRLKTISQKTSFRAPHPFNILLYDTILYNILLYIYTLILYLSKHFIYIISSAYISDISKAVLNLMLGISATPSRSQLWIISYSSLALFVALLLPNLQLYDCTIVKYVYTLHCTYTVHGSCNQPMKVSRIMSTYVHLKYLLSNAPPLSNEYALCM